MLTNAYVLYVKVNEEFGIPKRKLLSQHDFRKIIAIAWINKSYFKKYVESKEECREMVIEYERVKRKRGTVASISSISSASGVVTRSKDTTDDNIPVEKKQRATALTDVALKSVVGKFACRLIPELDHLPMPKTGSNVRCALHRWGNKTTVQRSVMMCPTCNIQLCLNCYKIFHSERDLVGKKNDMFPKDESNKE